MYVYIYIYIYIHVCIYTYIYIYIYIICRHVYIDMGGLAVRLQLHLSDSRVNEYTVVLSFVLSVFICLCIFVCSLRSHFLYK